MFLRTTDRVGTLARASTGKPDRSKIMRVCDKHPRKKAVDSVILKSTDSHFDLCEQCILEVTKFLSKPKQVAVEPKRSIFGREKSA